MGRNWPTFFWFGCVGKKTETRTHREFNWEWWLAYGRNAVPCFQTNPWSKPKTIGWLDLFCKLKLVLVLTNDWRLSQHPLWHVRLHFNTWYSFWFHFLLHFHVNQSVSKVFLNMCLSSLGFSSTFLAFAFLAFLAFLALTLRRGHGSSKSKNSEESMISLREPFFVGYQMWIWCICLHVKLSIWNIWTYLNV